MSTRHLRSLGNSIRVNIPADEDGYVGRECPNPECLGYFKVTFGTGRTDTPACVCPYCGTTEDHDHFWTQEQLQYARSVAERTLLDAVHKDLKSMEFEVKPPRNALLGIGISFKVGPLRLPAVRSYGEKKLETEIVCDRCTLRYAIYGVFGWCPDCGAHNNLRILEGNLELVGKMLALADEVDDPGLRDKLIENALEDCVSAFDGWGRAATSAFASCATDPDKAAKVSFQNLRRAQERVKALFDFDISGAAAEAEFHAAHTLFQKRHLLAHGSGVIDEAYLDSTGDRSVPAGRKVRFGGAEIRSVMTTLRCIAGAFLTHLESHR